VLGRFAVELALVDFGGAHLEGDPGLAQQFTPPR
jgi:hypothetical protein